MAKYRLNFDTTDATTKADSDKILSGLISSSDGSTLITDTLEGGKQGLDVYVINTSVDTTAGAEKAEDAAHSSGDTGNFMLAVRNDSEGTLVDTDGDYAPLQVDDQGRLRVIADLDFTAGAEKAEDSAHSSADIGNYVLAVRQDTLAASTDADGDYSSFKVNGTGELYTTDEGAEALLTTIDADTSSIATDAGTIVTNTGTTATNTGTTATNTTTIAGDTTSIDASITALSQVEDAAHSSGDSGIMGLAVRNDTLGTLVDTDGDYAPLQVNASGELYVTASGVSDVDDTADTSLVVGATSVDNTVGGTDIIGTDLTNRKFLFLANEGNKAVFLGNSGVTTATGFPLYPGSMIEMRAGANIDVHAIGQNGNADDIRYLEMS